MAFKKRLGRSLALPWGMGALAALLLACVPASTSAVTQLKRQMDAPPVSLKDGRGNEVNTTALRGRILILVFGEIYHEKTRQAYDEIDAVLRDTRFKDQNIAPLLITARLVGDDDLKNYPGKAVPSTILHDPLRTTFETYEVAVMPSIVIIDKEGKVVHAVGGLTSRFPDVLADSLLYATGRLSAERFEESLHPRPTTAPADEHVRADRIALLARQLVRRGLDDMAVEKYTEAIGLDPHHAAARLELGQLLLKRRRLAEAEKNFQAVLADDPASLEAKLGVAYVQASRGGPELPEAEITCREILARSPSHPRAHYLLGLILEQRGKTDEAILSFKKAAQLLLERKEQEQP
jgi:tetratricopeptide (TPR) repeat protein